MSFVRLSLLTPCLALQVFSVHITKPGHRGTNGGVYPDWEDVAAKELLAEKEFKSATQEPLSNFTRVDDIDLIGLIEFPYSGSTWLRFLLAGAIGFPSCSKYSEPQSSCGIQMGWSAACPCTAKDFAHFSPRGWKPGKNNPVEESQPIQDAFEYIPGTRIHAWSTADRVMLRKSHLFSGQSIHIQEVKELNKLVWLVRHPLDVMHSVKKYGHVKGTPHAVNKFYDNVLDIAMTNFEHSSVLIVRYESLCAETAAELMKILKFLGKADAVEHSLIQRMLDEWPELACRYADLAPSNSSMEAFGDEVEDILRELQPALKAWESSV